MTAGTESGLDGCRTLMLDMDGTVLDLAFDNHMWMTLVPEAYAQKHELDDGEARRQLYDWYRRLQGTLEWYCLDHWSERLGIDVFALHREHSARIDYLPGAKRFLEALAARQVRVLLVTNSHRATLSLKAETTGLDVFFDRMVSSHDVGHPKEDRAFWQALNEAEPFDPETTLFVDDNVAVLRSAGGFGIRRLLHVTRPDTSRPASPHDEFAGIESVAGLLAGGG